MERTVEPMRLEDAERFCAEILPSVSRTFALSIRLLPGELGRSVLCSYLLCRIIDTIEDDPALPATEKGQLFDGFLAAIDDPGLGGAFVDACHTVSGNAAHVRLVRNTSAVLQVFQSLPPACRQRVRTWVGEMTLGMKSFVHRYPSGLRIQTLEEYKEYCYFVAGTVGFLLTDLWFECSAHVGMDLHARLRTTCAAFGEALQTVNILKDVHWDAAHENSIYIPQDILRRHGSSHATLLDDSFRSANQAAVGSLMELAWADLDRAQEYLLSLPRLAVSIRLFCALPLLFACATLRDLAAAAGKLAGAPGTGSSAHEDVAPVKITRAEVKSLMVAGGLAIFSNSALKWLVAQVRRKPFLLADPAIRLRLRGASF